MTVNNQCSFDASSINTNQLPINVLRDVRDQTKDLNLHKVLDSVCSAILHETASLQQSLQAVSLRETEAQQTIEHQKAKIDEQKALIESLSNQLAEKDPL